MERGHHSAHRRPGGRAVPGQPVQRTRRARAAPDPGVLRHLRARQRRRGRPGPVGGAGHRLGRPAVLPRAERAGHGPRVGRLRHHAQPAAGVGVHRLDRPRLGQHAHRRRARHHQPDPGAAAGQRHLRHPGGQPGAAGAGAAQWVRHLGQRRVPPAVAVLRPGVASRAAARRPARRDARARRPGRDRGRHARAAPGRPSRGPRLARRAVRPPGLARRPARARAGGARQGGRGDPVRPAPAARGRGRGPAPARRPGRPPPTTGRQNCSPNGSGTSRGRRRNGPP